MSNWFPTLFKDWLELGPPMGDGGARQARAAARLEQMRAASVLKPGEMIRTDGKDSLLIAAMARHHNSWRLWFNAANADTARLRCHSIKRKRYA